MVLRMCSAPPLGPGSVVHSARGCTGSYSIKGARRGETRGREMRGAGPDRSCARAPPDADLAATRGKAHPLHY